MMQEHFGSAFNDVDGMYHVPLFITMDDVDGTHRSDYDGITKDYEDMVRKGGLRNSITIERGFNTSEGEWWYAVVHVGKLYEQDVKDMLLDLHHSNIPYET